MDLNVLIPTRSCKLNENAFKLNSFNENIIQYIETTDRAAVDFMLAEMTDFIDVIVPEVEKVL